MAVPGSRSAEGWGFPSRTFAPNHEEVLGALLEVAAELGRTPAQTALRWCLDQPFMTSVIVGARSSGQVADSLGAAGWRLPDAVRDRLDAVSRRPWRYPRATAEEMAERRRSAVRTGRPVSPTA